MSSTTVCFSSRSRGRDRRRFDSRAARAGSLRRCSLTAYDSDKKYEYVSLTGVLNIEAGSSYNTYTVEVAGYNCEKGNARLWSRYLLRRLEERRCGRHQGFCRWFRHFQDQHLVREIATDTTTPTLVFTTKPQFSNGNTPQEQKIEFVNEETAEGALVEFLVRGCQCRQVRCTAAG